MAETGGVGRLARRPAVAALAWYAGGQAALVLSVLAFAALRGTADPSVFGSAWDAGWYAGVAEGGYSGADPSTAFPVDGDPASRSAFFPLLPLALRGLALLGLVGPAAQALLGLALGAIAVVQVHGLMARLASPAAARRAAALAALSPGAFVFVVGYAEALLLVLALWCLTALVDQRWLQAGIAGALASAARPTGALLAVCCASAAVAAARRTGRWDALVAPALAPLGVVVFFTFLWRRTGDPLAWFTAQRAGWGQGEDLGLLSTWVPVAGLGPGPYPLGDLVLAVCTLAAVAAGVLLWRWRPPAALGLWSLGVIALALPAQAMFGVRPRFLLTAIPLLMAVAQQVEGWAFRVLLGLSGLALVALGHAYLITGSMTP